MEQMWAAGLRLNICLEGWNLEQIFAEDYGYTLLMSAFTLIQTHSLKSCSYREIYFKKDKKTFENMVEGGEWEHETRRGGPKRDYEDMYTERHSRTFRLYQQQQREYVWEEIVDRNSLGSLCDNECLWF